MSRLPTVVCIVGPTACHKTETAVQLARRVGGEIVSADSVSVYRGLDVGSAKPTVEERSGVPHHMIDVADIDETDFTVARFREEARAAIDGILSRNNLPIVVGGSGLYSDAIFSDMRFSAPSDPAIRRELEEDYAKDANAVFARLRSVDPVTADRLHPNDAKRVIRALEVYCVSGKPYSAWNDDFCKVQEASCGYTVLRYGLTMDRNALYARINARVDRMFARGLQEEAYALFQRGYTPDRHPAMQAIGYSQLYDAYLQRCTVDEAREAIKLATRHFAKRQLTWFRRNPQTVWFSFDEYDSADSLVNALEQEIRNQW
ncbi:MAG: tRNA (adenosine(37)-N6)-dimethylallyltransferase MiaA [Clostridia bacterium]|nr:tRNA (adenosine(37)-N6)-dimethylallyltransferase MiaA [Clostridia bacterium]